jgi:hypothetical protein
MAKIRHEKKHLCSASGVHEFTRARIDGRASECRVPHPQHGWMLRVLSRGRGGDSGGCVCFAVGMRLWT